MEKNNKNGILRLNLTITTELDKEIVEEFKQICKKQRKRYTKVAIELFKAYIDDYKATR